MGKIQSISDIYRTRGIEELGKEIWAYTLIKSPLASVPESLLSDVLREKLIMAPKVGYWPQLKNPRSFNEKVAHRKHYTNKDVYAEVSDKWRARKYVQNKVGKEILNEVYHITDDPETIPFEELPNKFVIKATHGSGMNIIVNNKEEEDLEAIKDQCSNWISEDYGEKTGEYWYQEIEPKIMVERYLHDEDHGVPLDFKFFTFHGDVKYIQVDLGRFSEHTRRIYDRDWNPGNFTLKFPKGEPVEKPSRLNKMIKISETLGENFAFVRVDLYCVNNEIIFGEMTLAPGSGHEKFTPLKYDFLLGSHW